MDDRRNELSDEFIKRAHEMDKQYMSNEAQEAFTVHAQIITGFQMQEDGIYLTAKGYKIMRDKKLYKAMGYDTFEKYCEVETGISRMQVYNYIRVAEKIPQQEFVNSGLQNLGIKKLTLLSALTEEQRAEIVENTDLENTTVKELKDQIARLAGEKLQLKNKVDEQEELIDSLRDEINNQDVTETDKYKDLQGGMRYYQLMCRKHEAEIVEKAQELAQLEAQIRELKSRPIEVQATNVPVEESEEYKRILDKSEMRRKELLRVCEERNTARAELEELKKQMTDPDKGMKRYVIRMTERQLNGFCKAVRDNCPEYSPILRDAEVIE